MLFSRAAIALLATAAPALSAIIHARTAAQVEADVTTLTARVTTLDNDVNAFPATGGSLLAALQIHTDATNVDTALKQATTDTTATTPLSEADGQAILAQIQNLEPVIVHALDGVIAKKSAFAALPIGGITTLVKQDIATLSADTKSFENALVSIAPADLVPTANGIIANIDAAFARATAAYA